MTTLSRCIRTLALAAPLVLPLMLPLAAHAFDLTVEVLNPKVVQGTVNAALYNSAEAWLKESQSVGTQKIMAAEKTVIVYRNLPAGPYAVSLFHDENGNGKLDANVIGIPTERYGFSRDARGRMGPPAFADAVVDVQADTTLTITLK